MIEVCVRQTFTSARDSVFARISDHERFLSGKQLRCTLSRFGTEQRNGCGAVREITAGMLQFSELITAFAPPDHFEYQITALRLAGVRMPFHHVLGRMQLTGRADATEVVWQSRFRMRVPLVGRLLERRLAKAVQASFRQILARAAKD